jgi:hypothetical protein
MNASKIEKNGVTLYRVNNDVNGNPRYVVHFLFLDNDYNNAHKKALSIGGAKYRSKWFGGGFVFQSYNIRDLANRIKELN